MFGMLPGTKIRQQVMKFGWMLAFISDSFPKEADMQNLTRVLQVFFFCYLRDPTNEFKSELKSSIPKRMPTMINIAPGARFGSLFATFWGQFCMSVVGARMGTLEECGE